MAQPVGALFGTRWPNRAPGSVPARAFPAPLLGGGGAKVPPMTQGGMKYHIWPGGGACYAPPSGRKNGFHTVLGAEI